MYTIKQNIILQSMLLMNLPLKGRQYHMIIDLESFNQIYFLDLTRRTYTLERVRFFQILTDLFEFTI